jgi:SagB-type dehydrogenase family enzyme
MVNEKLDLGELYHENTNIAPYMLNLDEPRGLDPLPPGEILARMRLPAVDQAPSVGLEDAILGRVSSREFDATRPLPLTLLSRLLALSCGFTTQLYAESQFNIVRRRAQPSAGGKYPIETYPIVLNVEGLHPGVYHYDITDHTLEFLRQGAFQQEMATWTLSQPYMGEASVLFVLAGCAGRIRPRYGERGYRYMLLESGHIAQNLYLLSTAYGLGAVANGGFVDAWINRLIGLGDTDQSALYIVAVGVPKA